MTCFRSDSPEKAELEKGPRGLYLLPPCSLLGGISFRATLYLGPRVHVPVVLKAGCFETNSTTKPLILALELEAQDTGWEGQKYRIEGGAGKTYT